MRSCYCERLPDLPTRAFLNRLALTGVQRTCKIYALVDWNRSGLWIYSTYVTGGASNVNESTKYALRNAVFLGVSHEDILAAGKVLTSKHTKKESRDIAYGYGENAGLCTPLSKANSSKCTRSDASAKSKASMHPTSTTIIAPCSRNTCSQK